MHRANSCRTGICGMGHDWRQQTSNLHTGCDQPFINIFWEPVAQNWGSNLSVSCHTDVPYTLCSTCWSGNYGKMSINKVSHCFITKANFNLLSSPMHLLAAVFYCRFVSLSARHYYHLYQYIPPTITPMHLSETYFGTICQKGKTSVRVLWHIKILRDIVKY